MRVIDANMSLFSYRYDGISAVRGKSDEGRTFAIPQDFVIPSIVPISPTKSDRHSRLGGDISGEHETR
jgi:hypothetical protein